MTWSSNAKPKVFLVETDPDPAEERVWAPLPEEETAHGAKVGLLIDFSIDFALILT